MGGGTDHHGHNHTHGHGHAHAPADFNTAFATGVALNTGFVVVEAVYGFLSDSMALVADAGHNLSDVLGLLIAWGASSLAKRKPSGKYTYGLRSSSILAALANALLLLVAVGAIAGEAIRRLFEPAPVAGMTVVVVAAIGIVINTATALLFMRGRKSDLNIRGAYLHMAADAAVSAGVVLAGFAMLATGWEWIDAVVSLAIVTVIAIGTWGLLRRSVDMSLNAVPYGVNAEAIGALLRGTTGVAAVHDLHIWPISTTETALTAHLIMPGGHPGDAFLHKLARHLHDHYGIAHPTLQIETTGDEDCALAPDHVV